MNDSERELIEAAARAAGLEAVREFKLWDGSSSGESAYGLWNRRDGGLWNPLRNHGDRYRLARRLGMVLDFSVDPNTAKPTHAVRFWLGAEEMPRTFTWPVGDDKAEGLAIVRASSLIGQEPTSSGGRN